LSSASILARQLCPSNWRNLQNLFNEATHKPYSYLIVDLTQNTPELFKYRNNIFNEYFNCYATNEVIEKNQEIQGHAIDLGQ
jgi:poly(3-hydroxyalkanoate) synthetase